jgi:hypothetical protein
MDTTKGLIQIFLISITPINVETTINEVYKSLSDLGKFVKLEFWKILYYLVKLPQP